MALRLARPGRGRATAIRLLLLALLASVASCARDASGDTSSDAPPAATTEQPTGPLAAAARAIAPDGPYRVVAVHDPGAIRGVISLDRMPPRHDTTLTGEEAAVCGARMRDHSVVARGHELEGALVWISGIREGRPLPRDRRADLAIVRCQFVPRVLALAEGTTINLQSKDATVHHTRFYSESEGELISRMLTVDRWAVVPSARIAARAGLVRVRLNGHPYVRAFVAVFQHPYFAVTNRYGRYRISGLPAGTYHVRVWHERAEAPIDTVVTVKAGLASTLDLRLHLY